MTTVKKLERVQYTQEEWMAKGHELYGEDKKKWRFVCPMCGNIQSVESMKENNPSIGDDTLQSINFNCEGRYTPNVGCDWTLGGLLQIHTVEILADGKAYFSFAFADGNESQNGNGS